MSIEAGLAGSGAGSGPREVLNSAVPGAVASLLTIIAIFSFRDAGTTPSVIAPHGAELTLLAALLIIIPGRVIIAISRRHAE